MTEHKHQSKLAKAILEDIVALESLENPGHIMDLRICAAVEECEECPLNMGSMGGACCAGLLFAARRHYQMYRSNMCSKSHAAKRYATLADWMGRRLLEMPQNFTPPPCSKRCTEAEE